MLMIPSHFYPPEWPGFPYQNTRLTGAQGFANLCALAFARLSHSARQNKSHSYAQNTKLYYPLGSPWCQVEFLDFPPSEHSNIPRFKKRAGIVLLPAFER
jgi:hypothetical protein